MTLQQHSVLGMVMLMMLTECTPVRFADYVAYKLDESMYQYTKYNSKFVSVQHTFSFFCPKSKRLHYLLSCMFISEIIAGRINTVGGKNND